MTVATEAQLSSQRVGGAGGAASAELLYIMGCAHEGAAVMRRIRLVTGEHSDESSSGDDDYDDEEEHGGDAGAAPRGVPSLR